MLTWQKTFSERIERKRNVNEENRNIARQKKEETLCGPDVAQDELKTNEKLYIKEESIKLNFWK